MKLLHTISFTVHGVPQAKQYQQTRSGVQYVKPKVKEWEKLVGMAALVARNKAGLQAPWVGPCEFHVVFSMPRAKSNQTMDHLQKPDVTNLQKSFEDGIKRVLIADDAMVFRATSSKIWWVTGAAVATVYLYEQRSQD
jgi:Holliday junction resolvase RusA-like endonuclease